MKRVLILFISVILLFVFSSCKDTKNTSSLPKQDVPSFSYNEILKIHKENTPGVKYSGFKNSTEEELTDTESVINRAKNECTVDYDTIEIIGYDRAEDVWCVHFYTAGLPGGDESVYLSGDGITCLIVYGE